MLNTLPNVVDQLSPNLATANTGTTIEQGDDGAAVLTAPLPGKTLDASAPIEALSRPLNNDSLGLDFLLAGLDSANLLPAARHEGASSQEGEVAASLLRHLTPEWAKLTSLTQSEWQQLLGELSGPGLPGRPNSEQASGRVSQGETVFPPPLALAPVHLAHMEKDTVVPGESGPASPKRQKVTK